MILLSLALVLWPAAAAAAGPQIRLEKGVFQVTGAPPGAAGDLVVYAGDRTGVPPLLGERRFENGVLTFTPRFPLQPGMRYRAVYGGLTATFDIPARNDPPTTMVAQVFPSAGVIPENQLKFYIHFSAPMSRGEAYRRIRLLDPAGKPVDLPFLELDEELWDPEGRRLTVFFDPGRIKSGLVPREEVGAPLEAGKSYRLVIDQEWRDAANLPLKEGFEKRFQVGPEDREPPDPKTWRVTAPSPGGLDPLAVEFPEPMDHALLERVLEVADARGRAIRGSVHVDREERRWRFFPESPWRPGEYSLVVAVILEDLAGNTIGRPFEVDVFERVEQRINRETVSIPFHVR